MFYRPCFTLPRKTQESTLITSSKGPPLACFITSTPMRTRASLLLTCVHGKGKWRAKSWTLIPSLPLYLQFDAEILFIVCAVLSSFTTTCGWPTWEPTGKRWRRRPWWRHSQRSADMLSPWTSTRQVTCFTHQEDTDCHRCEVSCYVRSSICGLDVGGAGEEPCQPAVHHGHSSDARWRDDLAGAGGAVLRASTRWKHNSFSQPWWTHELLRYPENILSIFTILMLFFQPLSSLRSTMRSTQGRITHTPTAWVSTISYQTG